MWWYFSNDSDVVLLQNVEDQSLSRSCFVCLEFLEIHNERERELAFHRLSRRELRFAVGFELRDLFFVRHFLILRA